MVDKTKFVPAFEVQSDDFTIQDKEGNTYHPHAGEWVVMRTDMPWRMFMLDENMDNRSYCQAVIEILKRQIVDWTWTGNDSQPLPRPKEDPEGFEKALWNLSAEERQWLRAHCWDSANLPNA